MSEADLVRGFEAFLASVVRRELQACRQGDEWIDQYRSPLRLPHQKSSKRHCQLVRDRIARLGPNHGAFISPDEKQFFLTTAALCEEMTGSVSVRPLAKTSAPEEPAEAEPAGNDQDEGYSAMLRVLRGAKS